MGHRRGSLEIIVEILKIALKGATKTQIMYKANLSYNSLVRYLNFLQKSGFIEDSGRIYRTTNKGVKLLTVLRRDENWESESHKSA